MVCENRCWQKSAQQTYTNAEQAFTAAGTMLSLRGVLLTDTGESIDAGQGAFRFAHGGLYRVSVDVTSTPTEAGVLALQLYMDGVPMEEAVVTDTVAAGGIVTQHVETVRRLNSCCAVTPVITARVSGAAGVVNHASANAVKLA